jgi:hypothetical protein
VERGGTSLAIAKGAWERHRHDGQHLEQHTGLGGGLEGGGGLSAADSGALGALGGRGRGEPATSIAWSACTCMHSDLAAAESHSSKKGSQQVRILRDAPVKI